MAKKVVKLTFDDANQAAADYFEAENELQRLEAEKQLKILDIQKLYGEFQDAEKEKIKVASAQLKTYCTKNRGLLLTGSEKSGTIGRVVFSFKYNKGKLVTTGEHTWEGVLAAVEEKLPDYVRRTVELDKARLLDDADTMTETLEKLGIAVEKKEHFSLKLKD